ncbi:hypothetical protein ATANTOWER_001802 [Ataeniobius toweri]|uniref:Uncharacterized protein n=1 Tax=Ataeniobius toweri TaxID=208326 RepID=A0ABU7A1C0_9TELE|nr:hypothetical protein [Ataeniobius toweri]
MYENLSSGFGVLLLQTAACAYVVRKIRASVADGEQEEKPIRTPCSAKAQSKLERKSMGSSSTVALNAGHDESVAEAAATGTSSEAAVQSCRS